MMGNHCRVREHGLGREVLVWVASTPLWLLAASSRGLPPPGLLHPGTNVGG
jgi:hypothetical protein